MPVTIACRWEKCCARKVFIKDLFPVNPALTQNARGISLTNKMLLDSSQRSSQRAETGHGTVPSLIVPPWWPQLRGRGNQAYMFFFQPGKMIKASVAEIQHDGSQCSRWSWRIWTKLRSPLFPSAKTQTNPSSSPKTRCRTDYTGYIITALCFSWMVHVTEHTTAGSSRGWVSYAVAGESQFYDLKNPS